MFDCIVGGFEKKNCVMNVKEKEMIVYYEVGYVIVVEYCLLVDCVLKVFIILRGIVVLGYM